MNNFGLNKNINAIIKQNHNSKNHILNKDDIPPISILITTILKLFYYFHLYTH